MWEDNAIYFFNPKYRLRLDKNRVLIFYKHSITPLESGVSNSIDFLHPLLAILLIFFDGTRTLNQVLIEFSSLTGLPESVVQSLIAPLLENSKKVAIPFDGNHVFHFPKNMLVRSVESAEIKANTYDPSSFLVPQEQLDFITRRLYEPLDLMFHLNNICSTRCVYCFVDKRTPRTCQIPFPRIKEIIHEARDIGMRSFGLTGGEVFNYPHWRELLHELVVNGFDPIFATKYPLNEEKVRQLKETGIRQIIFSLDTLDKQQMVQMMQVGEKYYPLILKTLRLLDAYDFEIRINTQVTSINKDSIDENYIRFLSGYKNIRLINIQTPGYSRFPKEKSFVDLLPDPSEIDRIGGLIDKMQKEIGDRVKLDFFTFSREKEFFGCSFEEKEQNFNRRSVCSGNFTSFQILPDGKVTICEELYNHPQFIIGDLKRQSIREMWNSPEALRLYRMSQDDVGSQSSCKTCNSFDSCHTGKGVCWKLVLYAYGDDRWDWPDPRCPHAPEPEQRFWL